MKIIKIILIPLILGGCINHTYYKPTPQGNVGCPDKSDPNCIVVTKDTRGALIPIVVTLVALGAYALYDYYN
jgi:hypothetical protein